MDIKEDYISLINNKYIIHRKFNEIDYIFGEKKSLTEAKDLRNQINDDGWPIKKDMPVFINNEMDESKILIKNFIDDQIIYNNKEVSNKDPNINKIYREFNIFFKDENIHVPLKRFKYYFPRLIDKKFVKRVVIDGSSRYNISFKNNSTKENKIVSEIISKSEKRKKEFTSKNTKFQTLHGSDEIKLRLNEFIKKDLIVLNRIVDENDPTLDDIYLKFNQFLMQYNETINKHSLSNYFSQIYNKLENSDKQVFNNKTHYNLIFSSENNKIPNLNSSEENQLNNHEQKYKININEINNIVFFNLVGFTNINNFDTFMNEIKNFKKEIAQLNIKIVDNSINFDIDLVETITNKDILCKKLKILNI